MKKFPIKQAIEFAAKTMWDNIVTILLGSLFWFAALAVSTAGIVFIGGSIVSAIAYYTFRHTATHTVLSAIQNFSNIQLVSTSLTLKHSLFIGLLVLSSITVVLALLFVFNALRLGFDKFLMQFEDGHIGSINTIFSCFSDITIRYTIAAFLKIAAVFFGLLCLIVPGIYLWIKFRFYTFSMLDRNTGSVESLQHSYRITKGYFFILFITVLLMGLFSSLINSALITIFITAPFTKLINIYLYRFLRDENQ